MHFRRGRIDCVGAPGLIALACGAYFAAEWLAALLVASPIGQTIPAVLATLVVGVAVWAVVNATDD
jgi:hypothetical protein